MTPMVFQRFREEFSEVDWSMALDNPFGLTNIITAMLEEAKAKHQAIFIQAALVPLEWFYGPGPDVVAPADTPTGETEDAKAGQESDSA